MFDDSEDEEDFFNDEGDLSEDIEKFEAHLKGKPIGFLDSDRWEVLIDHFMIIGQYHKAITAVDEALLQFSYNNLFKLRKAQANSAIGKLKEALNLLSELERSSDSSFELYLTKASVFSQLRDSKNAIRYFKEAIKYADPEDRDEIYLDLAMEYEATNDFNAAIKVLDDALAVNSKNEGAIYEKAFCFDQMGELEKSISCYSDYIDENPYSFTAWYNLGNAYSKLENFEKAIWAYDYCILINEDFGPAFFNLGNAYLSMDKYNTAIENFNKCVEIDGDDPIAFCYIGECYEQLGELELAKHFYKLSLELHPMLSDAWLGLGIVEDLEGNTTEGLTLILKAKELDPENGGIYHVLAGAYEKLEEYDKALENYELSLAFEPNDEECLTNYIQLISEESWQNALAALEAFTESNSENPLADVLKVNILWNLGRYAEAVEQFKLCLITDRENAMELFDINPALKSAPEFVHLGD